MKIGIRGFSLNKRIAARTSWKRVVRHSLGLKAPRGWGWLTDPRKAAYNRVYNRTTTGWGSLIGAFVDLARWGTSSLSTLTSIQPGIGATARSPASDPTRRPARSDVMSEQTEYAGFEASEFAENPEPRVPCVLLGTCRSSKAFRRGLWVEDPSSGQESIPSSRYDRMNWRAAIWISTVRTPSRCCLSFWPRRPMATAPRRS